MTSRLLTSKQKKQVRELYKDNPVLQTITAAYKDFEGKMNGYRFSPEEVWLNCFIYFDNIIDAVDKEQCVDNIWDDIYCDICDCLDDRDYEYDKNDATLFTSCVAYSIIGCLVASNEVKYVLLSEDIMSQISNHIELDVVAMPFDGNISFNYTNFISLYLKDGIPLSKTIDTFLKYGRLDNKSEEDALIKSNKIFRKEIVFNGERRTIVFTKLKLFIEEFFVQKCQNGYEWLAVWIFFDSMDMITDRDLTHFTEQMNVWFPCSSIKCPKSFRNFIALTLRNPEEWKAVKRSQNLTDAVVENMTVRYNTMMNNYNFPE